ncbi:HTH domain-containing protein [Haloarcula sp. GH36]|uniref:HTH domain-containing protein n=1 Tax=Haloarcula montana TaxID=3111776 RepID=UPI002D79312E|nr:HTH domain-containing protein [Haloarcula sp. GH36]
MESNPDSSDPSPEFSVELFVRSLAPHGAHERQQAIVERLEQLQEDDCIESVTCTVWGDRICPETAPRLTDGRSVLQNIARLRTWAQTHDASLEPFFAERTVQSACEDTYTVIVPPVVCLAISRDEELWGVFPCRKADDTLSAMDGLATVADFPSADPLTDRPFAHP